MTSNIRAQADNSKGKIKEQGPKQRKKVDSLINYYQSDTVPRLVPLHVNEVSSSVGTSDLVVAMGMDQMAIHPYIPNVVEPDRSKVVGEIPIHSSVTASGGMSHSVPVEVAAGRNGMQPNLTVAYASQAGNGVMGKGWSIGGLSAITATNASIYYDGKAGGINLNKTDQFDLDGNRLIKISETSAQIDFETEHGNIKVTAYLNGNSIRYFKVFFPNGTTGIFGNQSNMVHQVSYPVFRLEDRYGNYVSYVYSFRNEHYYITKIEYGGAGSTAHFASVDFEYIARGDINTMYMAGKTITEDYLLNKIVCKTGSEVLRTYSFSYEIANQVSLLKKIDCSSSGGSLNPLSFYYGNGTQYATLNKQNTQLTSWFSNTNVNNLKLSRGKFDYGTNDDGLVAYPNLNPYLERFQSGSLFSHSKKWYQNNFSPNQSLLIYQGLQSSWASPAVTLTAGNGFINMFAADIDGVPGEEIIKINNYLSSNNDQVNFAIYKPNLYAGIAFSHNVVQNFSSALVWFDTKSVHPKYFHAGDFNGDGKMEMLVVSAHNPLGMTEVSSRTYLVDLNSGVKLFDGGGINYKVDYAVLSGVNDDKLFVVDYNGDGKSDICHLHDNALDVYTFDITGTTYTLRKVASNVNLKKNDIKWREFSIGELNGDGKPDLLVSPYESYTNTWQSTMPVDAPRYCGNCGHEGTYQFGSCSNCYAYMPTSSYCYECSSYLNYEYDYNTGSYSYLCPNHGSTVTVTHSEYVEMGNVWSAYFSKGDGTFDKKLLTIKNLEVSENIVLQDMNKDGTTDLVCNRNGSINIYLAANGTINNTSEAYNWVYSGSYVIPSDVSSYQYHSQLLSLYNDQVSKLAFNRNDNHQRLLTGTVNSFGVVTKTAYGLLNEGVYDYGIGNNLYSPGYGAAYPYENYQGPLTVVAKAEAWLKDVQQAATSYLYNNAIVHRQGLGFLGFTQVTTFDDRKGFSFTRTNNPFQYGVVTKEESSLGVSNYEYAISTLSNKIARVRQTKKTTADQLKGTTVITTYSHDSYGNILNETVDYSGGIKTITTNTYINAATALDYIIGVPATQTIRYERGGAATTVGSTFAYNAQYSPLSKISAYDGNTVKQEAWLYDAFGNVTQEKTKPYNATAWQVTIHEYDAAGRFRMKTTNLLGLDMTYSYNTNGTLASQTDHKGNSTLFEYDSWQQLKKTNHADGTVKTVSFEWQPTGTNRLYAVKEELTGSPTAKTHHDALNRKLRSSVVGFDGAEVHTDQTFDEYGRLSAVSLPFKNNPTAWTNHQYDQYDRLVQVNAASGSLTSYGYSGNSITETKDGATETKTFDASGQLLSVASAAGTLSYNLRPDGQPTSIIAPGGIVTSFSYDVYGRKTQLNDPSAGLMQYGYDDAGNLNSQTDATGKTVNIVYDNYNRVISKETPEFTTTYTYDTDGKLQAATSTNGTSKSFVYDNLGRVTQSTEAMGTESYQVNYTYQSGKLSKAEHLPVNYTVNYQYNTNGYLSQLTNGTSQVIHTISKVNIYGQEEERVLGNGLMQTNTYNGYGLLTERKTLNGMAVLQQLETQWDNTKGNLLSRKDVTRNLAENFGYDALSRLTTYGTAPNTMTYNNATGNILSKTDVGSYNYGIGGKPYAVSSVVANGSPLPTQTQTVSYTSFAWPQQVAEGTYTASFTYNEGYSRAKMEVRNNGNLEYTRYYFGGGRYEKTVQAGGSTKVIFYVDGTPYTASVVLESTNGAARQIYLSRDHLGSITHIADAAKNLLAEYSYDAWGRLRNPATLAVYAPGTEPDLLLHRGYTGHEHLEKFGLINMNARLYDPLLGRMLSPDKYVQETLNAQNYNRYTYCLNNPLRYTDESGDFFLGTMITAVVDFFRVGLTKGGFEVWNWGSANFRSAWREYDPTRAGSRTNNAFKIDAGMFKTDPNRTFAGRGLQILSRLTWESPQIFAGKVYSHARNIQGAIDNVDYYGGATLVNRNTSNTWDRWGLTLGYYINSKNVAADPFRDDLFRHEFGHTLQSRLVGPLYLTSVGIPSGIGQLLDSWGLNDHSREWYETQANRMALRYFERHEPAALDPTVGGIEWDFNEYPTRYNPSWFWGFAHPPLLFSWWLLF